VPTVPARKHAGTDNFGDSMPRGVLARLGTTRFRIGQHFQRATLSPDNKLLAVSSGYGVALVKTATGHSRSLLQSKWHGGLEAAFTPDGKNLIVNEGNTLSLWDVGSGKKLRPFYAEAVKEGQELHIRGMTSNGKVLAVVVDDKVTVRVRLCDIATEREVGAWTIPRDRFRHLELAPGGKLAATVEVEEQKWSIHLRESATGKAIRCLRTSEEDSLGPLAFAPDSRTLAAAAVADGKRVVILWDTATWKEVAQLQQGPANPFSEILAIAFSPDGKTVAWGGLDRIIHLWDIASRKELRQLRGRSFTVAGSLAFSQDGTRLYSASGAMIRVWNLVLGKEITTHDGHGSSIEAVAWRDGGKSVATYSLDRTCRLWDTATAKELGRSGELKSNVIGVATFNAAGTLLLTQDYWEHELFAWDVPTGRSRYKITGTIEDEPGPAAFSPDGKQLAATIGNSVLLFDAATGKTGRQLVEIVQQITLTVWSPDSRFLAVANFGSREQGVAALIRVVDVANGKIVFSLRAPESPWSLAFSPDGRMLAAAGRDAQLRIWETATGKLRRTKKFDESNAPSCLAWSPDNRTLACGGRAGIIELWDVGQDRLRHLEGHRDSVRYLAFSPDGRELVSGSTDTAALIWDVKAACEKARPAEPASPRGNRSAVSARARTQAHSPADAKSTPERYLSGSKP
jgi:WD40 repeat protein